MAKSLFELAQAIQQATELKVELKGNGEQLVSSFATIEQANDDQITFLANAKYKKHLLNCQAGAVILAPSESEHWAGAALVMENPYAGFAIAAQLLDNSPKQADGVHATAFVSPSAKIGKNVKIGANATIEADVVLGDNTEIGAGCYLGQGTMLGSGCKIWPNATLYHSVKIGDNSVVHANSVIGADGFGYAPLQRDGNQHWLKIPQTGGVTIGSNTEIGASTTIDRGAIADTKIGNGVIIDNQIQLGHNVEIGDFTAIAAGTMIAGSTRIGKNVTIGGVCAISGHLNICDRAFITGRAFVMKDISEPGVYSSGMPATENTEWRKNTARYRKLAELFDRVKTLEKTLDND